MASMSNSPLSEVTDADGGFLNKPNVVTDESAADRTGQSEFLLYTVQEGDNLETIANLWGVSAETIKMENNLYDVNMLKPGKEIRIPPVDGVIHKVEKGQTISGIAQKYGVGGADIMAQNGLDEDEPIQPGMNLVIPGGTKELHAPAPVRSYVATSGSSYSYSAPSATPSVMPNNSGEANSGGFIWPTVSSVRMTQGFGAGGHHTGVDLATREANTPNYAAASGTVIVSQCGWNGGYGCYVKIDHGDGLITLYGHFASLNVSAGQYVNQGDVLGIMGSTGRSTGPHLHFEVIKNGRHTNPLLYF